MRSPLAPWLALWLALWALAAPAEAQAPAAVPLVDHHQHLFSPDVAGRSPSLAVVDAERLIALLDAAGIGRAVVLSLAYQCGNPNRPPIADERECVRRENDWTSTQAAGFPGRLAAFCSVNPLRPYALEEIARCATDPRLRRGLKLHFGNSDVRLDDAAQVAAVRAVFAAANRAGMAIVVHARANLSQKRPYGAALARTFLDVLLPAAPDVPVTIAHLAGAGGYDDPQVDEALGVYVAAVENGDPRLRHVYFDVSGVAGLGDWRERAARIADRIRALGVSRVLYGSDGAGGDNATPAAAWAAFRELPLTGAELATIAGNVAPYLR